MNEETKDTRMLPVVAYAGDDDAVMGVCIVFKEGSTILPGTELCRLTDAQARLAEKDARIASLEHGNETLRLMRDELKSQVIDYRRRYSECIVRTDNSETLANALKEIERLREANLRLDEEWQAMQHDLSVAQAQLELLQAAPAERGVAPAALSRAFITGESVDGNYRVVIKSATLQETQQVHNWLARLNPAPATADSDVREVKS